MNDDTNHELEILAALYALGDLPDADRAAFEEALARPEVSARLSDFQQVVEALAWAVPAPEPPPALRARLLERVQKERSADVGRVELSPGLNLVLAERLPWRAMGVPGIRCKPLFVDPLRRYATSLVTMDSGATYPGHRHTQLEELFVLSGDLVVGGYQLQPGDYCRSEAGTWHETIHTETGVTFVALASLDDRILPEQRSAS